MLPETSSRSARYGPITRRISCCAPSGTARPTWVSFMPIMNGLTGLGERAITR